MNMKVGLVVVAICAGLTVAAVDGPPPLPAPSAGSASLRARLAEKAGGYIYKVTPGKTLKIYYREGVTDAKTVSEVAASIRDYALFTTAVTTGVFSKDALADASAGAWVFVDEWDDAPALLVAPEEAWAKINVKKLKEGDPSAEVLAKRIQKEVWRGAAIAMGGSDAMMQPSLMRSIKNNKMIDVAPDKPTPDTFNKMIAFAKDREFGIVTKATYRAACKAGWAPAPTNDVQKAIWAQVHQLPDNPIKIEFNPKTDK